jgi:hypothetical protein
MLYKRTNYYKNGRLQFTDLLNSGRCSLRIVNIGSTYSQYAFDTLKEVIESSANFALENEPLYYDNILLRKNAGRLAPHAIVVVVVAPCLLLYRYPDAIGQAKYYALLSKDEIHGYGVLPALSEKIPALFAKKNLARIIKRFDQEPATSIYDTIKAPASEDKINTVVDAMATTWCRIFALPNLKDTDFSQNQLSDMKSVRNVLREIITFCSDSELRPVIVIPPFSAELNAHFSSDFLEKVLHKGLWEANSVNAPVFDYQHDDVFQTDKSLFADGFFRLSKRGSRIFVKKFLKDLNDRGIAV